MLQLVNVGNKSLLDYGTIASRGLMEEIRSLAAQLEGKRVLHLSATAFGGGVAEINYALVPLMRDAGLDTRTDAVGNLWGRLDGSDPRAPRVITGSHAQSSASRNSRS